MVEALVIDCCVNIFRKMSCGCVSMFQSRKQSNGGFSELYFQV